MMEHSSSASALQTLLSRCADLLGDTPQINLAVQIAHNLRYQHDWSDVRIHVKSAQSALAVPMISGVPPQRLYIHPDEQIDLLQKQKQAGKTGLPEMPSEREWVLPTHLRDKWSLQRFAAVFDAIQIVPDPRSGTLVPFNEPSQEISSQDHVTNPWRKTKRVALATLDDDSTVVFYIVHDGIVKPRQN